MPLVIDPPATAASCVIWLHGLGADSSDFYSIVPEFNLPANHHTRFIFPDAPLRKITINNGMQMRGWYDIASFDFNHNEDQPGILASTQLIWDIIAQQMQLGIKPANILLAGFSQGAAISLYAALCYPHKLAGAIALSGYLPISNHFMHNYAQVNLNSKILQAHGLYDPIVSFSFGEQSSKLLKQLGFNIKFNTYNMEHTLCMQEIDDIANFIKEVFAYV
jgi:phospholipase/carboxylesterase